MVIARGPKGCVDAERGVDRTAHDDGVLCTSRVLSLSGRHRDERERGRVWPGSDSSWSVPPNEGLPSFPSPALPIGARPKREPNERLSVLWAADVERPKSPSSDVARPFRLPVGRGLPGVPGDSLGRSCLRLVGEIPEPCGHREESYIWKPSCRAPANPGARADRAAPSVDHARRRDSVTKAGIVLRPSRTSLAERGRRRARPHERRPRAIARPPRERRRARARDLIRANHASGVVVDDGNATEDRAAVAVDLAHADQTVAVVVGGLVTRRRRRNEPLVRRARAGTVGCRRTRSCAKCKHADRGGDDTAQCLDGNHVGAPSQ